jgi:hypothetical protein
VTAKVSGSIAILAASIATGLWIYEAGTAAFAVVGSSGVKTTALLTSTAVAAGAGMVASAGSFMAQWGLDSAVAGRAEEFDTEALWNEVAIGGLLAAGFEFSVGAFARLAAIVPSAGAAAAGRRVAADVKGVSSGASVQVPEHAAVPTLGAVTPPSLEANAELVQRIATRAEAYGARQGLPAAGGGPLQGTLKHDYAKRLLDRYQRMIEDRGLLTESSWQGGARARYGSRDSVRLDVLDEANRSVFDYKFTRSPDMSLQRVVQIGTEGPQYITDVIVIGP